MQVVPKLNPRGLIAGPDNRYYQPAGMILVPDTCRQTYAIVTQDDSAEKGL